MADFGSPVAQDVNVNGLKSLSDLMSLQHSQQGLELQRQEIAGAKARVQQEQQTAGQRAGTGDFFKNYDVSEHMGADGTLDMNDVLSNPKLRQAAGDSYPEVVSKMLALKQGQLQNKQSLVSLNDDVRKQFQSVIGGLRTDPDVIADTPEGRKKVETAIGQFGATSPDASRVAQIYAPAVEHAPQGKLALAVSSMQLQAQDASTQASHQAPSMTSNGAALTNVNPQAAGGNLGGTPDIPLKVGPGMATFTDQAGNTWATNPQNPGHAILVGHGGAAGGGNPQNPPAGPSAASPPTMDMGEAEILKKNTSTITSNRQSSQDALTQRDILGRIQSLAASPGLYTGPGSQTVAEMATAVAKIPGFEKAAQYANNYNELSKFMAQNAARMGSQMGLDGSDARLDVAIHSQPNTAMDARTIQNVAQYMSGLVRMQSAKADAMDRWLSQKGNSARTEHEFERVWRDNADPRLFQLAEMKDAGEAQNYSKLHIKKSDVEALTRKHDVLASLGAL